MLPCKLIGKFYPLFFNETCGQSISTVFIFIFQVNHFGTFVRYFFNLPPPSDQIHARMVLTTLDSAAYYAMQAPQGPVHINCAFREPLDYTNRDWNLDCLRGLDKWFTNSEPYTRYLTMKMVSAFGNYSCSVMEILQIIEKAEQGLLLVGALHTDDDMWAVALLAKHLSWPIATDILSGLRLRKVVNLFPQFDKSILFIDHIDQILLSDSAKNWISPDVIVQVFLLITHGFYVFGPFPFSFFLYYYVCVRYFYYVIMLLSRYCLIGRLVVVLLANEWECFSRLAPHLPTS